MRRSIPLALVALTACIDISLTDEVNWPDGALPGDGAPPADGAPRDGGWYRPDADGDAWIFADSGVTDTTAPWLVPAPGCAPSEALLGPLCVSTGPVGVALRLWASEEVIVGALFEPMGDRVRCDTPGTEHHIALAPLPSDTELLVTVEIEDRVGLTATEGPLTTRTTAAITPIVVNEVLFDPLGPEPHQEFIELHNLGPTPISLDGWTIADEGASDLLTAPLPVPAGGYAVIVSSGYSPGAGGDPFPAAGAVMIRLDGTIGSQGLRNSGEALTLSAPGGAPVSASPAPTTAPASGASLERASAYLPDGDPANWLSHRTGSATPGAANSVAGSP